MFSLVSLNHLILRNLLFLLLIFSSSASLCQSEPDEVLRLKGILNKTDDLKNLTEIYNDLAWEYSDIHVDSANYYVDMAIASADELNDPLLESGIARNARHSKRNVGTKRRSNKLVL